MLTSGVRRNPTINSFRSSFSSSFTWKVAPTATRQRRWDRNDSVSHLNKTTKMSLEGLERRRRRLQIAQIEGGGEGGTPDYDYGVVDLSLFLLLCLLSKGKKKERTINLRVVWWWYKNRKKKKRASSHSSKGKQWRWRRESSTAKLHTQTHQEQVGTHEHTAVKHKESLQLALKRSKLKWAKVCGSRRTRNNLPFCALSRVKLSTQLYSKPLFNMCTQIKAAQLSIFCFKSFSLFWFEFDGIKSSLNVWHLCSCLSI